MDTLASDDFEPIGCGLHQVPAEKAPGPHNQCSWFLHNVPCCKRELTGRIFGCHDLASELNSTAELQAENCLRRVIYYHRLCENITERAKRSLVTLGGFGPRKSQPEIEADCLRRKGGTGWRGRE